MGLLFQTDRLVAKTNMRLIDGQLVQCNQTAQTIDIFRSEEENMQYALQVQLGYSFVFFDKQQLDNPICYISYSKKNRSRYELHWETLPPYKQKGYMTEALTSFVRWMQKNTKDTVLWALIQESNLPSIKTANRCGFKKTDERYLGTPWYMAELTIKGGQ